MKKLFFTVIIFITSLSLLAQTADLSIENATAIGTTFSFEVHITRTNQWDVIPLNSLGSCSYYFDINSSALSNPTITFTATQIASSHTNTVAFINVGGTDKLRITSTATSGGGSFDLNVKTHIYTVSLDIDNTSAEADLVWDEINTGLTNALNIGITENYSGNGDIPLPVELSSFSVNAIEGTKAQLQWETATEVNNYGFEIERAIVVEESDESAWEMVAFVEGHGNSNSPKVYSFTDKNLVGGSKFMYRLKQIDIDGQYEYTDAVEVEVLPTQYELFQNYPNPFNPSTNIKFSLPEDTRLAINIYNLLGERVATVLNEQLKAGFHQIEFNSNSAGYNLASGVYIYSIESKNFSKVKKMILMK